MKTYMPLTALLVCGVLYAASVIANEDANSVTKTPQRTIEDPRAVMVSGFVKEKSDKELIVTVTKNLTEAKVVLTDGTHYFKDSQVASIADVKVGTHIRIIFKSGTHEALLVRILDDEALPTTAAE